jgi:hypothetical protein
MITSGLDGDLIATLKVMAITGVVRLILRYLEWKNLTHELQTVLDTGKIVLYEIGLPGLDVPGCVPCLGFRFEVFKKSELTTQCFCRIYSIGPSLRLTAQATASIGASLDFTADIAYQTKNSKIVFPHTSESVININALPSSTACIMFTRSPSLTHDADLNISSNPVVAYTGTLKAHLTPTVLCVLLSSEDIINQYFTLIIH